MLPRVLVSDCPWSFKDSLPGNGRGADKHYQCMTTEKLCNFQIPEMSPDSFLFMWRVASMQQEVLDVIKAWGYKVKSEIVWVKTTKKNDPSQPAFGMGHYVRASHEVCLICTRGKAKVKNHSTRSVFYAPRGIHSAKPDEFYKIVENLTEGPYVELFARKIRPGWTQFGNELGK